MSSINSVLLLGRVGNVEVKTYEKDGQGRTLVQASIATSESYKGKDGEWKDNTEWHRCIFAINSLAERASKIQKGDQIEVRGSIKTNKWTDKEGNEQSMKEIAVTYFSTHRRAKNNAPTQANSTEKAVLEDATNNPTDDDLPF
jgi:single-strand DNA-binding protein